MTNLDHIKTLDAKDFAEYVFQKSLHWNGFDDFVEWLNSERVD